MNKSMIAMKNWRLLLAIRKDYAKDGAVTDLKITRNCVNRLREVASTGEHLRIMVDGGGCSGFEYKMSLDNKINDSDLVFCKDDIKVVVDEILHHKLARSILDSGSVVLISILPQNQNYVKVKTLVEFDESYKRAGKRSLQFLKGATVDYSEDLMRSSFRIVNNPIAEKGCSCGSSFAVKMD